MKARSKWIYYVVAAAVILFIKLLPGRPGGAEGQ